MVTATEQKTRRATKPKATTNSLLLILYNGQTLGGESVHYFCAYSYLWNLFWGYQPIYSPSVRFVLVCQPICPQAVRFVLVFQFAYSQIYWICFRVYQPACFFAAVCISEIICLPVSCFWIGLDFYFSTCFSAVGFVMRFISQPVIAVFASGFICLPVSCCWLCFGAY